MFNKLLSSLLFVTIVTTMMGTLYAKTNVAEKEIITAIKGGVASTKKMLKKVPINYYHNTNGTLLHYAVKYRKPKVVELLVQRKILISRKGGRFYGTALQDAIYYGHLRIASYLIDQGSLLNTRNINGDTALHIAARNGYLDIIQQLVARGASKNSVNKEGKRPYDLIPNLSWESKKELKETLAVNKEDQPNVRSSSNKSTLFHDRGVTTKNNKTINIIDKKTQIENTHMGVDVDIHRTSKF